MTTCPCGTTVTNAWICNVCKGRLARDLRRIADLWPDSEDVLTRQTKTGSGGGKGKTVGNAKSTPLPFDERASEVRWIVENTITTWAPDLCDEQIPEGVSDVPTAAVWMSQNLANVVRRQESVDLLAEIDDACRQLVRLVDVKRSKNYLGFCACGEQVWAWPGDLYARCPECGKTIDLEDQRAMLREDLNDRIATPSEIAAMCSQMFGMSVPAASIRWYAQDGLIAAKGQARTLRGQLVAAYRVGDVLDVAARIHAKKIKTKHKKHAAS